MTRSNVLLQLLAVTSIVYVAKSDKYTLLFPHSTVIHGAIRGIPGDQCEVAGQNCTCLPAAVADPEAPPMDLFELLSRGSEFLQNYTDVNEAVMLVGRTGAGKTTATQMIAGNLSKLHAVLDTNLNLVIIDEENRIGLPSIKSKTLFPELVEKVEPGSNEKLPFYDFPGFDDTRGAVEDIAANFFITEVVKKITRVKMLFLVIQSSINGEDRDGFNILATHAANFINNLDKFDSSIALVVTKVKNFNDFGPISDETIFNGAVRFLQLYKSTLEADLGSGSPEENELTKKKISFVEHLLHVDVQGKHDRIWFIRTPRQCGVLSEQDGVIQNINNITEVYNRLEYTRITGAEFGFTLKDSTKLELTNYTVYLNKGISNGISQVVKDFKRWYPRNLHKPASLSSVVPKLQNDNRYLLTMIQRIKRLDPDAANPSDLSNHMSEFWNAIGYPLSRKFVNYMDWQETYFVFFDKAAGNRQERRTLEWIAPILEVETFLSKYVVWYEFLLTLEQKVYNYTFQSEKPSPPATFNAVNWLEYIEKENILPVSSQVKSASEQVDSEDFFILENMMINAMDTYKIHCQPLNRTTIIQQNFLVLSLILPEIPNAISKCPYVSQVHLHATSSVFLDADINMNELQTDRVDIVIFAPFWIDIQNKEWKLQLQGRDGLPHSPASAENGRDGTSGSPPGAGISGCAGKPGESAKAAFCVALQIRSQNTLQINTKGGNGGPGQNGGTGGNGVSVRDSVWYSPSHNNWDMPHCAYSSDVNNVVSTHNGYDGAQDGAAGGSGGKGGNGGNALNSTFIYLKKAGDFPNIEKITEEGQKGAKGKGSAGGTGGRNGKGYRCISSKNCVPTQKPSTADGRNGDDGISDRCLEPVIPTYNSIVEWNSILQYKLLSFNYTFDETMEFISEIDLNQDAQAYFTLIPLAEELVSLDHLDRTQVNLKRLQELYVSLLVRLNKYYVNNFSSASLEEKKAMSMLLVLVHSSVINFESPLGRTQILETSMFLDTSIQEIERLSSMLTRNQIYLFLDDFSFEFRNYLEEKLAQTSVFIDFTVVPALQFAAADTKSKLNLLGKQIADVITDPSLSLEDAKKKINEAEKTQRFHKLWKIFETLSDIGIHVIPKEDLFGDIVSGLQQNYTEPGELQKIAEIVRELIRSSQDLEAIRKNFEEHHISFLHSFMAYVKNVSDCINNGAEIPFPQLGLTLREVISKRNNVVELLELLADESLATKSLVTTLNFIQDASILMTDLFENINHYLDMQAVLTHLSMTESTNLQPITIKDPTLKTILENFDTDLIGKLIKREINEARHVFQQFVFPFGGFYNYSESDNSTDHILYMVQELDRYIQLQVGGTSGLIYETEFTSNTPYGKPFFTWRNEDFLEEIKAFFSGKIVHLNADVRLQPEPTFDAIKFSDIRINFTLKGATEQMQEDFRNLLDSFKLTMTHSGVSYYRFEDDFYATAGKRLPLQYSFERDAKKERHWELHENSQGVHLSPFTDWSVQLLKTSRSFNETIIFAEDYAEFDTYIPYIDLELVGIGTYVESDKVVEAGGEKLQLDKYYYRESRLKPAFSF